MRYPRTSINGKLRIGTMPSAVVCTGEGWDNLTVPKRRNGTVSELAAHSRSSTARKRDRARALAPPTDWAGKVQAQRKVWELAAPGQDKREALKVLRYLEIKAGIRSANGQTVLIEDTTETWASGQK